MNLADKKKKTVTLTFWTDGDRCVLLRVKNPNDPFTEDTLAEGRSFGDIVKALEAVIEECAKVNGKP